MEPHSAAIDTSERAVHPDRERAQTIIDGLPECNPARERALEYFTDPRHMAVRTSMGIAEGMGSAMLCKTLGAICPMEDKSAMTQALLDQMRLAEQLRVERATMAGARRRISENSNDMTPSDLSDLFIDDLDAFDKQWDRMKAAGKLG